MIFILSLILAHPPSFYVMMVMLPGCILNQTTYQLEAMLFLLLLFVLITPLFGLILT